MSKKSPDYSNTIIYKICCKDENIKDLYVGHTTNFIGRKYSHKKRCKKLENSEKNYETIRNNGGWENWDMIEIASYCCKDRTEARMKEHEHYINLKASLNSSQPFVNKPCYLCSDCNLEFTGITKYNSHIRYCCKNNSQINTIEENIIEENIIEENIIEENIIEENIIEENTIEENIIKENIIEENIIEENDVNNKNRKNVYFCNCCNYYTNKSFNYDKHLMTTKHKINSKQIPLKQYNC
jgi:hypothetical protein